MHDFAVSREIVSALGETHDLYLFQSTIWTRLENRLEQMAVSDEARREVEKSLDRLVNKLLHPPLASLRDDAAQGHQRGLLEALKQLFSLGD